MAPTGPDGGRGSAMAPGKKITARIKRTLPVRGPQAPTLSELMRWYCLNTNTHGCRRIVVSRGRLRRFIWILLTLSAVGLILWQCAELLLNYYSASVSVTVQFQKLPFPAVTICNINPYKYSSMKDYLSELDKETKKALETFYGFSEGKSKVRRSADDWNETESRFFNQIPLLKFEDFSKTATDLRSGRKRKIEGSVFHKDSSIVNSGDSNDIIGFQLCDANNSSECALYTFSSGVNAIQEWYKLHYMNIMAQIPLETKEELSYSADDLLLTCFFDGLSCDKRHFTRFHHPLHGNCYTFNSGENGTILSTSTGGSEYGLQVVLYIDEADYNPFLVTSTGAKIIVHDQDEYPFIEDIGTEIETAAATSIGMHFTRSRKLSKPYSDCTETGADIPVENLYNKSYSLQICLHSCFQKAMVESCGCAQYTQPLPAGAEYCNYKKNPNWMYCYYRLHEKFVKEQLGCQQICKDACSFKEWALTTSIAQWPSIVSEDWMLRVLSWDKGQKINKLNKTDLANLMVFYKDLNERFISENPTNTIVILLSNFGGQLGLWMSCSVVCVIEIVEVFFIDSLSIVMRRQWQKAKKWWNDRKREGSGKPQVSDVERQGHDNPVCIDEDLPTFNTALRLPLPQETHLPRTPPPNYSTLRLETAFTEQLPDTLEAGQH
ncbi:Amiloride-sensitive sodium channel subunit gamma [Aix galericulata]|nr:Amiloride-sensitive sodium channel subunit gamma [Aix galericulata]